jgi:DME family drug/metabolite transporter
VFVLGSKLLLDAGHDSNAVIAVTFMVAAVVLLPVALTTDLAPLGSVGGVIMVAHLGVLTVAVGYLLFGRGLSGVGVGTAGTLTLAEPATAATLGLLVLGERPGVGGFVGLLLIGTGLLVLLSIDGSPVRREDETGQRGRPIQGG